MFLVWSRFYSHYKRNILKWVLGDHYITWCGYCRQPFVSPKVSRMLKIRISMNVLPLLWRTIGFDYLYCFYWVGSAKTKNVGMWKWVQPVLRAAMCFPKYTISLLAKALMLSGGFDFWHNANSKVCLHYFTGVNDKEWLLSPPPPSPHTQWSVFYLNNFHTLWFT